MTVGEFKQWVKDHSVPDDASIILGHPGGWDEFKPYEYDVESNTVSANGTG